MSSPALTDSSEQADEDFLPDRPRPAAPRAPGARVTGKHTPGAAVKTCTSCGTTSTPVWRWGGQKKDTLLCNACSLRLRRSANRPRKAASPKASLCSSPSTLNVDAQAMSALMGVDSHSMTAPAPLLASIKFHLEIERMRLLGPQMETPLASQPQQFYYEGVPAWLHQPMHHHQQQQYAV